MLRASPFAAAATVAAWIPPAVFALRWPDYSPSRDFISELGAAGAPDATAVNITFAGAGALFVTTCAALARGSHSRRVPLALISLVGWSYVVAAGVPCDAGCPSEGSATQALHNAVGAMGYLAGGVGLLLAAGTGRGVGHAPPGLAAIAGTLAITGIVGMGAPELSDVRGAVQRAVELGVFGWLMVEASAFDARRAELPHGGSAPRA